MVGQHCGLRPTPTGKVTHLVQVAADNQCGKPPSAAALEILWLQTPQHSVMGCLGQYIPDLDCEPD